MKRFGWLVLSAAFLVFVSACDTDEGDAGTQSSGALAKSRLLRSADLPSGWMPIASDPGGDPPENGICGAAVDPVAPIRGEATAQFENAARGEALAQTNGALVGLVTAIVIYVIATVQHLSAALMLSVVVFLAMTGSCIISTICGAIVPLTLKKLGADPATASSIFLTTATDMVSMGMLLGLATVLVK